MDAALCESLERRLADVRRRRFAGLRILPRARRIAQRGAVLCPHGVVESEARRIVAEADEDREIAGLESVAVLAAVEKIAGEHRAVDDARRRRAVEEDPPLAGNL